MLGAQKRRFGWVALGVLVLGLLAAAFYWQWQRHSLTHLREEIRAEVPLGTRADELDAWALRRWGRKPTVWSPLHTLFLSTSVPPSDLAGVPRSTWQCREITIPLGKAWISGQLAENWLTMYFTLDEQERVTGHYFLTLDELAVYEKSR